VDDNPVEKICGKGHQLLNYLYLIQYLMVIQQKSRFALYYLQNNHFFDMQQVDDVTGCDELIGINEELKKMKKMKKVKNY